MDENNRELTEEKDLQKRIEFKLSKKFKLDPFKAKIIAVNKRTMGKITMK